MTQEKFDRKYLEQVKCLLIEYNWHEHRETCWKHLRPGEPRDDQNCRMRINGTKNPTTYIDNESGSIMLRRLHPCISNYNELLTFLLHSNTDMRYIGSGEAAKALVYYVTDYITKSELPVHAGLAAVQAAMEKMENQYKDTDVSTEKQSRSVLIKCLNAIMAHTELSHQQVMSYLVGGGDVYRSHDFKTVIWGDVEHYLNLRARADVNLSSEEMLHLDLNPDQKISASNDVRDYAYCDHKIQFDNLCLYEYLSRAYKTKKCLCCLCT
jgi:hypothetical protein